MCQVFSHFSVFFTLYLLTKTIESLSYWYSMRSYNWELSDEWQYVLVLNSHFSAFENYWVPVIIGIYWRARIGHYIIWVPICLGSTSTCPATLLNKGEFHCKNSPQNITWREGQVRVLFYLPNCHFFGKFTCSLQQGMWLCCTLRNIGNIWEHFIRELMNTFYGKRNTK